MLVESFNNKQGESENILQAITHYVICHFHFSQWFYSNYCTNILIHQHRYALKNHQVECKIINKKLISLTHSSITINLGYSSSTNQFGDKKI